MIRALGSLVTKSYDNSLLPGLAIHYAAGHVAYGLGDGAACAMLSTAPLA